MKNLLLSTISILGVTTTSYAQNWMNYSYYNYSATEKNAEAEKQPNAEAAIESVPVLESAAVESAPVLEMAVIENPPEVNIEFTDPDIAYSTRVSQKQDAKSKEPPSRLCREKFWISGDYLLAWEKNAELDVPLITTGAAGDAIPGAIGQPGTRVIFGKHDLDFQRMQGMKVGMGVFVGENRQLSVDAEAFWIFPKFKKVEKNSDALGNPVIARPFFNTGTVGAFANSEYAILDSKPVVGVDGSSFQGGSKGSAKSQVFGAEANVGYRPCKGSVSGNLFAGFRYLHLSENIIIKDKRQFTSTSAAPLFFNGLEIDPPNADVFRDKDSFETSNNFYGGQIGGKLSFANNTWFECTLFGKIGLGMTQENVDIEGKSSWQSAAFGKQVASGGILALPTNMGEYTRWEFGYLPEGGFNFNIGPFFGLRFNVGYSFLYLNRVARPGAQIDHNSNIGLIPNSQVVGSEGGGGGFYTPGPQNPHFEFENESYWLQTANFGITFDF